MGVVEKDSEEGNRDRLVLTRGLRFGEGSKKESVFEEAMSLVRNKTLGR